MAEYSVISKKVDSILLVDSICFKDYGLSDIYLSIAEKIAKTTNISEEKVPFYFKKAVLLGYSAAEIFFPKKYKELEHLSDSMYIVNCNKFIDANINLQVGFLLRFMIRRDQGIRTREMMAKKSHKPDSVLDKIGDKIARIDSVNAILLGYIFQKYGYPGWKLAGSAGGVAVTLMFYMPPKFQLKYIHLIQQARKDHEIFIGDTLF